MTFADSIDIRFECPHCGQPFVVEASGAGLETSCPICESTVVVPQLGTLDHRDYGGGTGDKTRGVGNRGSRAEFANPDSAEMREELIDASIRAGRIERELDESQAEVLALRQQLKAATGAPTHAEYKALQADRAGLKSEMAALKQRLGSAETQLAEARARAADLQSGLALANEELAASLGALDQRSAAIESQRQQLSLDLDIAHEKLRAIEAELAVRSREAEEAAARVGALEQQLGVAKGEIVVLQDESGLYRRNFDEAQTRLAESGKLEGELKIVRSELQATQAKLGSAEDGCRSLSICCEELRKEAEGLRRDLESSTNGRELLDLRARFAAREEEHRIATGKLALADAEVHRLTHAEKALRSDLDEARRARADAERRAEAGSESKLSKDNLVLRGIIDRQNDELTQRLHDLNRLRRAELGLKLVYAVFAVGLLGVAAFAIHVIPLIFK